MNALYKNRICNVIEVAGDITLDGRGVEPFDVSLSDPALVIEPTDEQVANASNLAEGTELTRKEHNRSDDCCSARGTMLVING
jgi:hypothetical protein